MCLSLRVQPKRVGRVVGNSGMLRCHGGDPAIRCAEQRSRSASPALGQNAMARSAWAVMVSDGFTPRFAETVDPSTMCSPG